MKIMFWNTHRNNSINSYIIELVEHNEIDVFVLAEYTSDTSELNNLLKQSNKRLFKWNTYGCERIQMWGNYVDVTPAEQN